MSPAIRPTPAYVPRAARAAREGAGAGALTLRGITRRFGAQVAVDDVSLEVRAGELLALIGASGSGKTTTLRIAAGYEHPDAGTVLLGDAGGEARDITRLPPQKRGFGMVFQHYALFPHLSVAENVAFGLEARGVRKGERLARARQALENVGLGSAGGRPVQSLSGGEQQRVALARALVIEPRVLLLDEPLSNLDPTLRVAMRDELRAMLHRLQVTALFVTHDQEDAFAIADRVALMRKGRILQVGSPEALYDHPASRAVAEFIGRASLLPAVDEGREAVVAVAGVAQRVHAVADRGARGEPLARALAVLRPEALAFAPREEPGVWPARVVDRRFAGSAVVYRVRLGDEATVEVASSDRTLRDGDTIGVRVASEPIALVRAEEEDDDGAASSERATGPSAGGPRPSAP